MTRSTRSTLSTLSTRPAPLIGLAAVLSLAAAFLAGCGSRCPQVAAARDALSARAAAPARGRDVRVVLPFARVNELLAATLREQPLSVPLEPPDLGPIQLAVPFALSAVARQVELRPGPPDRVRFATRVEIHEGDDVEPLTSLAVVAEVTPVLERRAGAAELLIRFGADSLISLTPELPADAEAALLRAFTRRLPAALRDRIPQALRGAAARKLAEHLVGAAYDHLRRTLLSRLGERTGLRLRLPDVPVAEVVVRSLEDAAVPAPAAPAAAAPAASAASIASVASATAPPVPGGALLVEILTDLPVRQGLPALPSRPSPAAASFTVELSPGASAELTNWAIDEGHLPRWYTRGLSPSASGEFRPRFDYLADDSHPFKIYAFQERGGCSFFRVGVQARLAMEGERLRVTAVDRQLEEASASPLLEAAAWMKYFLFGSLDLSKRVAARTRLTIGGRGFESHVVAAALTRRELRFELQLTAAAAPVAAAP